MALKYSENILTMSQEKCQSNFDIDLTFLTLRCKVLQWLIVSYSDAICCNWQWPGVYFTVYNKFNSKIILSSDKEYFLSECKCKCKLIYLLSQFGQDSAIIASFIKYLAQKS